MIIIGQCDCCGKDHRYLHQLVYNGMDTSACAECCNGDEQEDREEIKDEINRLALIAEDGPTWAGICLLEFALRKPGRFSSASDDPHPAP